ncbi:MAG: SdrD B-like domain-containing protein, partial [Halobacteriota archaeon]
MKFNDLNGNGVKDPGEPGLPGWTIYNDSNNNGVFDPGELNVTTGAGGAYSFDNLEPGTYKICEVVKDGWAQTSTPICYDITLTDTSSTGNDFGNRGALSISGIKFNDLNGNGVKDPGEPGLSGWTINLEQPAGTVIKSTTTAADGSYTFTYLDPGTYTVSEELQPGWAQTCPAAPGTYSVILTDTSATDKDFGNRGALSISLEKSGSPAIVAPGGTVTYTINYTNTGTVPLHDVVITEHYPKGVTFISASPAPDAGTNNVWTIGKLEPGESGTIVIKVKVPEQIDLSFTETGSVIGEGLVMVTKDLSTEQKPYSLKNRVTLSCNELAPVSRYATTKVSGVPGTSLGITESGSGVYSSDEILDLETKNKTIILEKSTHAEYKPTSFNFSDSFSVDFTNKWKQDICSKNMEIDAAIHKKISDATYIDDETISRVDKD